MRSRYDLIGSLLHYPLVRKYNVSGSGSGNAIDILDNSDQITITKSKVGDRDIYTIGDQSTTGGGTGTTKQVAVYRGVYNFPYVPVEEVEKYSAVVTSLKNKSFTFDTGDGGYWWVALPIGTVAYFYFGVTNVQPLVIPNKLINGLGYDIYVSPSKNTGGVTIQINATDFPSGTPETSVNIAPSITLIGGNQTINEGDAWSEPGYSASDTEDGDITSDVVVGGDTVDPNTAGVYTITYDVVDSEGLSAIQRTRVVTVEAVLANNAFPYTFPFNLS